MLRILPEGLFLGACEPLDAPPLILSTRGLDGHGVLGAVHGSRSCSLGVCLQSPWTGRPSRATCPKGPVPAWGRGCGQLHHLSLVPHCRCPVTLERHLALSLPACAMGSHAPVSGDCSDMGGAVGKGGRSELAGPKGGVRQEDGREGWSGGLSSIPGPTHWTPGAPTVVTATDIPGTAWSALETELPPSGTCPPPPPRQPVPRGSTGSQVRFVELGCRPCTLSCRLFPAYRVGMGVCVQSRVCVCTGFALCV